MRRYIILAMLSICLLSITIEPVLAQRGEQNEDHGKASEMMKEGKDMREKEDMHGMEFLHKDGKAYGEYVTFVIDTSSGNILDYGIMGTTLFNISIANFVYKSTTTHGSVTFVSNTDGGTIVQLHDNPAAVINILANKSISITFTLASGVNATKEDNIIKIEAGNVLGYITGTGTITSSAGGTQVKVDASPDSAVVFRAAPVNMPMLGDTYKRFSQEIADDRVGLEVAFGRNKTYNSINYSRGLHLKVQEMNQDHIRLQINATEQAGNIIAFNIDNSSLVTRVGSRLRIHYDGQPIDCVNDPNIVFNGTDRPVCWISPLQNGVKAQLMLYIPKYSEHTIDILVEPEVTGTPPANLTASPTVTGTLPAATPKAPGFGLVFSLAGLLTWAFLVKRRNK
jgi:hypothetical protein